MSLRILSLVAICALLTLGRAGAAPAGAPVEIPVILPLTGPGALIGQPERQSFEVLEKRVNAGGGIQNRPLHFALLDDQGNPQVAVQLYNSVVARGAQVVFGGAFSATCKATAPLAERNGPVFYCLTPALRPTAGSYVFSAYHYPLDLLAGVLAFFKAQGWTRVGFLIGTDASGQEVDNQLDTLLARPDIQGVQAVAHEHFGGGDVSVAAQIAKIAVANPQALVVWSAFGTETAFRALRDVGLNVPVAVNPAMMTYNAMNQFAPLLPKQLYFGAGSWAAYPAVGRPVKDQLTQYYAEFKAEGIAPDGGHILGWDAGLIVVSALRKLGPDAKAEQIHAYIEGLSGFVGANGVYDFRRGDQRGLNPKDTTVTVWSPTAKTWVLGR